MDPREILGKLTELSKVEETKPTNLNEAKKPNESGYFADLVENTMAQQKPIPVVGKQNDKTQSGIGFLNITDTSPAAQAMQTAFTDLVKQNKAQIVMPTDPQNVPPQAGAAGQNAVKQNNQQQQPGQTNMAPLANQPLREVDSENFTLTTSLTDGGSTQYEVEYRVDGDMVEIISVHNSHDGYADGDDISSLLSDQELDHLSMKAHEDYEMNQADHADYIRDREEDDAMMRDYDQLDELSNKTLQSYAHKAADDEFKIASTGDMSQDNMRKLSNRVKGRSQAYSKMAKKDSVDEEQLDELSPQTLGSYAKKASTDLVGRTTDHDYMTGTGHNLHDKAIARNQRKGINRHQGIGKAVDKLTGNARVPANEGVKDVVKKGVKNLKRGMKGWEKGMHDVDTVKQANKTLDSKGKEGVLKSNPSKGSPADLQKKLVARDKRKETNEGFKEKVKGVVRRELQKDMPLVQTRRDYAMTKGGEAYNKGETRKGNQYMAYAEKDRKKAGDPTTNPDGTYRTKAADYTAEAKKAKPDFLDLDKDGNKKESMKKATADKKKQKIKESAMRSNPKISAARHEGKTHGLRGHAYHGKSYEDLEEQRAYHEGYKEGLDEGYMSEDMAPSMPSMPAPSSMSTPPMMEDDVSAGLELEQIGAQIIDLVEEAMNYVRGTSEEAAAKSYWYPHILGAVSKEHSPGGSMITMMDSALALGEGDNDEYLGEYEGEFEEGNAFMGKLANTRKGDSFEIDGKTYTNKSNQVGADVFESWDAQLSDLLSEGLSVSVSKGNENTPDQVSITATDQDAEELMGLVKNAGLGLFGAEEEPSASMPMSLQPEGEPEEIGTGAVAIDVGDSDGMLGMLQKLSGIDGADMSGGEEQDFAIDGADDDYSDEYDHDGHDHSADSQEQLYGNDDTPADEEDSDEEETSETCNECGGMMEDNHSCGRSDNTDSEADEESEAEEDKALAGADSDNEEELDESFFNLLNKMDSITEWANQAGKGEGKGTKAQFTQDTEYMTQTLAGGLNRPKATGQTTTPVITAQMNRTFDGVNDLAKLAGIKK